MHKPELVRLVSEVCDIKQDVVRAVLDCSLYVVKYRVCEGDKVVLVGFGTFEARDVAARVARHPGTGELIEVPAKRRVRFRTGADWKRMLG